MIAILLSIGDELTLGQTVDTNSAWMAQQLAGIGCDVVEHRTVSDDRAQIARTIADCAGRAELLILSGGLGPTEDDLTREALADAMGVPLELDEPALEQLRGFFHRLGRPMPDRNRMQAMFPRGAAPIDNPNGTAPGINARLTRPDGQACQIFATPGVPKEMKPMFRDHILPWVAERSGGAVILQKKLNTFGVGEGSVAERLGPLMQRGQNPSVGTTVSGGVVSVRINARFDTLQRAEQELGRTLAACRAALGDIVYGEDEQDLAQVVARLLRESRQTVATAESCTGGLLAKMLTDLPGSSDYLKYGWVVYSNEAKQTELNVSPDALAAHGAVSEPVVRELAEHAREKAKADMAVAISGVAGPGGGTDAKPVGMVCIGFAAAGTPTLTRTFRFPGDRDMVRDRSAKMALTMLRYHLLNVRFPF